MMPVYCTEGDDLWKLVQEAKDAQAGKWVLGCEGRPPGVLLAVAQGEPLWAAVQAKCEELCPMSSPHGSSRSTAMYHADGRACSALVERYNFDGTSTVWHVEAHDTSARGRTDVTVRVHGPWMDNNDAEWERRLAGDRSRVVIARHCWFTVGPGGRGGFGGHRFRFTPLSESGREVVSNDMWFGGVIPPAWRERIPDTHEMAEGFLPGPVE